MGGIGIAIDGPAGSGKSTAARMLAERLGYIYIDTGAMYRAVTLKALREGIAPSDAFFKSGWPTGRFSDPRHAPGPHRRTPVPSGDGRRGCQRGDSWRRGDGLGLPGLGGLRGQARLVLQQRAMARLGGVVMDGRDIGTVVLPDAEFKVYLHADPAERIRRRLP